MALRMMTERMMIPITMKIPSIPAPTIVKLLKKFIGSN